MEPRAPPDDLTPQERECFRRTDGGDWRHLENCPDCLEDDAEATLMDAAFHRLDGNEEDALTLEAEAVQLRARPGSSEAGFLGNSWESERGGTEPPLPTARSIWLRGLDLNQRPLGYEGKSGHEGGQDKPTRSQITPIYAVRRLGPFGSSRSIYFIVTS